MPLLSFVVAAYQKSDRLALCLHSIRNQIYRDYEIIVSDDGTPDDSNALVAAHYGATYLTHPRTLADGRPTRDMPSVMNNGVAAASGGIIQTLQEDHILDPGFALALIRAFRGDTIFFGLTDHDTGEWSPASIDGLLKNAHLPDGEARFERFTHAGRDFLTEFDDWRSCDGLDAAFAKGLWGSGLDDSFVGQGHEWLDMFLRWKLQQCRFAINPLMRLWHMDEPPAPNEEQWGDELAASYAKMVTKYGFDVWSIDLVAGYPMRGGREKLDEIRRERGWLPG
jgi:glycosyltransferase involved in cell wall biosynthesis